MAIHETVIGGGVLMTPKQVAEKLGLKTVHTLAVWRSSKRYSLPYIKVGRLIRYRESDVEEFIRRRCHLPAKEETC